LAVKQAKTFPRWDVLKSLSGMTWFLPTIALFKREMLTTLRRRRSYFVLFAAALAACMWFWASIPRANTGQFGGVAVLNQQLFGGAVFFLTLAVGLTVPALAGASIVSERRRNTYDLLLSSPISLFQLVVAKVAGALAVVALLVLGLLPITAVPLFSIGINTTAIIEVLIILGAASFAAAAGGVWISTRTTRPIAAIVGSYALTALLSGVPQIMILGISNDLFFNFAIPNDLMAFCMMFSPPFALAGTVIGEIPSSFGTTTWTATGLSSGAQFVLGLFFGGFALISLYRKRETLLPDSARGNRKQNRARPTTRFPIAGALADRFPVFVKDVRYELLGSRRTLVAVLLTLAIIGFAWLYGFPGADFENRYRVENYIEASTVFAILGLCVVVPMFVAGIFTKDDEEQNLDALLMLPLGRRWIARQKAAAGFLAPVALFVYAVVVALPALWRVAAFDAFAIMILIALAAIGVSLVLTTSCTLLASALAKSQAAAVVYAYVLSAFLMGGHALLLVLLLTVLGVRGDWNTFWGDFVAMLSPFAIFAKATGNISPGRGPFTGGDFWQAITWTSVLGVHLIVAGMLTIGAIAVFGRPVRRE